MFCGIYKMLILNLITLFFITFHVRPIYSSNDDDMIPDQNLQLQPNSFCLFSTSELIFESRMIEVAPSASSLGAGELKNTKIVLWEMSQNSDHSYENVWGAVYQVNQNEYDSLISYAQSKSSVVLVSDVQVQLTNNRKSSCVTLDFGTQPGVFPFAKNMPNEDYLQYMENYLTQLGNLGVPQDYLQKLRNLENMSQNQYPNPQSSPNGMSPLGSNGPRSFSPMFSSGLIQPNDTPQNLPYRYPGSNLLSGPMQQPPYNNGNPSSYNPQINAYGYLPSPPFYQKPSDYPFLNNRGSSSNQFPRFSLNNLLNGQYPFPQFGSGYLQSSNSFPPYSGMQSNGYPSSMSGQNSLWNQQPTKSSPINSVNTPSTISTADQTNQQYMNNIYRGFGLNGNSPMGQFPSPNSLSGLLGPPGLQPDNNKQASSSSNGQQMSSTNQNSMNGPPESYMPTSLRPNGQQMPPTNQNSINGPPTSYMPTSSAPNGQQMPPTNENSNIGPRESQLNNYMPTSTSSSGQPMQSPYNGMQPETNTYSHTEKDVDISSEKESMTMSYNNGPGDQKQIQYTKENKDYDYESETSASSAAYQHNNGDMLKYNNNMIPGFMVGGQDPEYAGLIKQGYSPSFLSQDQNDVSMSGNGPQNTQKTPGGPGNTSRQKDHGVNGDAHLNIDGKTGADVSGYMSTQPGAGLAGDVHLGDQKVEAKADITGNDGIDAKAQGGAHILGVDATASAGGGIH